MLAALKFFLGQDEKDPDESDDEDDDLPKLANPSKAEVYKATKKGTVSSKRKKAAKLKRVMAAVKKQQRKSSRNFDNFAAIQLLHDPQVPYSLLCLPNAFCIPSRLTNGWMNYGFGSQDDETKIKPAAFLMSLAMILTILASDWLPVQIQSKSILIIPATAEPW